MIQANIRVSEKTEALLPLLCEQPKPEPSVVPTPSDPLPPEPEPAEPPPDILPVPKLPDEWAKDMLPETTYVKPQ